MTRFVYDCLFFKKPTLWPFQPLKDAQRPKERLAF